MYLLYLYVMSVRECVTELIWFVLFWLSVSSREEFLPISHDFHLFITNFWTENAVEKRF